MQEPVPRLAAIADLCGLGRCSLAVCLPVASVLGVQVCPVPTALLSTQTDGFEGYSLLPCGGCIESFGEHWQQLGLAPKAVYSGFLSSPAEVHQVLRFADRFSPRPLFVADPVLGDNGILYDVFDQAMVTAMQLLCRGADVITPNYTEACLLCGKPAKGSPTVAQAKALIPALMGFDTKAVVITGIYHAGRAGALLWERSGNTLCYLSTPAAHAHFPGTGDLFASIVSAALCRGGLDALTEGVALACSFCSRAITHTAAVGTPAREGVLFEPLLNRLHNTNELLAECTIEELQ